MLSPLVPQLVQDRIRRFVDEAFLPRAWDSTSNPPAAMLADGPTGDGWVTWKAVDSPVTDADVFRLEATIGSPLPPLFRAYLMYKCLLMTEFGLVRLPSTPADDPLASVRIYVRLMDEQPYFRPRGLVPFGEDGNDGGPLCFDTSRPTPDGDYPVMFTDHELLPRPGYRGEQRWSGFAELLDVLETDLRSLDQQ